MIWVPNEAILRGPTLVKRHVDGPYLSWAGQLHWLTWRERLRLYFHRATIDDIAHEHWPRLTYLRLALEAEHQRP